MRDDRGQRRTRTLTKTEHDKLVRASFRLLPWRHWRSLVFALPIVFVCGVAIVTVSRKLTASTIPIYAINAVGIVIVLTLIYRYQISAATQVYRMTNRCAACTYDLTATPPDVDGCTQCPECGAAWRLPDPDDA
ncbi:MAG: hypothetical protein AAGH64_02915 [Planctomycetota bacterium]